MTQENLTAFSQLQNQNVIMKNLLNYIHSELVEAIKICKRAPTNQNGFKDERKINIAAFCTQLLDKISKQKEKIIQERK